MVNIEGLDKAEVLAQLYNHSRPQGLGFLWATDENMTIEEARELLEKDTYFDYIKSRVMKVNLSSDKEFDERLYDRDHWPGKAQYVIDKIREKHSKESESNEA